MSKMKCSSEKSGALSSVSTSFVSYVTSYCNKIGTQNKEAITRKVMSNCNQVRTRKKNRSFLAKQKSSCFCSSMEGIT